jgi:Phage holin family 2
VLFLYLKNEGELMQEHEKTVLMLVFIGAVIGLAKLLASDEKLTTRLVLGRSILGSASSVLAGGVLLQIPDIHPLALIAIATALGIMGSSFIESWLKNKVTHWSGK